MNARLPVIILLILSLIPVLPFTAMAEEAPSSLHVKKVENPPFPVDYAYGKRALCGKPSQRKKSQNAP